MWIATIGHSLRIRGFASKILTDVVAKLISFINEKWWCWYIIGCFALRVSMWLVIYRISTVRCMKKAEDIHMLIEWKMNASMLFIIAFVKFGNFFPPHENRKAKSMCEIGSLSELVEWSIQNKNSEKNNRQLCVGRSEHVLKAIERERARSVYGLQTVNPDKRDRAQQTCRVWHVFAVWPTSCGSCFGGFTVQLFVIDSYRRTFRCLTFGRCVQTRLLWPKMYFHLSTDVEMAKTGTERWLECYDFFECDRLRCLCDTVSQSDSIGFVAILNAKNTHSNWPYLYVSLRHTGAFGVEPVRLMEIFQLPAANWNCFRNSRIESLHFQAANNRSLWNVIESMFGVRSICHFRFRSSCDPGLDSLEFEWFLVYMRQNIYVLRRVFGTVTIRQNYVMHLFIKPIYKSRLAQWISRKWCVAQWETG